MTTDIKGRMASLIKNPQVWGFALSVAIIALISIVYFHPDAALGNELRQHDMQQGAAIGYEAQEYARTHGGDEPRWTNSLFSGMPTFQISPTYPSNALFGWITKVYGGGCLPSPSNLLFMMMLGMLIFMAAMRVRWYYGLIGAVAWGFSTYFIIIIGAGHIWKFVTLAYIPPTIAGIVMAYRGRWFSGAALAALFAMMQIQSNHIQMSYYFLIVIAILVIAYLVSAIMQKQLRTWLKATGALALAAVLAVGANLPNLYNTWKYSKESMRGGHSELVDPANPSANNTGGGLDRSYITTYSYGGAETFSLLIPNIKGGSSAMPKGGTMEATSVATLPDAADIMAKNGLNEIERQYVTSYVSQYFGDPEGTNGPVYVGAIIFALALLGACIVKGPMKWTMVVAAVLSILLAMGRHLMWFTDLFIDYFPMYSKFRTVESILVIAEFAFPVLGIMALQKVLTTPDGFNRYRKQIMGCFGACALVCIAGMVVPSIFGSGISEGDIRISDMITSQLVQSGYPRQTAEMFSINNPVIASAVEQLRFSMVKADSLRSLAFLLLAFGLLWAGPRFKLKQAWVAAAVGVLILIDLYPVNKRYLNHESFCSPQLTASDPFPLSASDRQILADTAMNYRVMDIARFQQAAPSRHHKMIGGYHAAKLTRYQDLIDRHLIHFQMGHVTDADMNVLNMLNARYIVGQGDQVMLNPDALGNAWFVDSLLWVSNPNEEMQALQTLQPATEAVADRRFASVLPAVANKKMPGDTIFETSYAPHRLTYHASTQHGGVAVFSEVYFPWGWQLKIDGKEAPLARVNYVLRAANIPAGEHTVEMTFAPASVGTTVTVARICVIIIYLLLLGALIVSVAKAPLDAEKNLGGNTSEKKGTKNPKGGKKA